MKYTLIIPLLIAVIIAVGIFSFVYLNQLSKVDSNPKQFTYVIVNTYPHDTNAFTEGLVFSNNFLYESTGLNGASSLRQVNLTSGEVLKEIDLSDQYFGEGIAIVNDRIIQLTYTSKTGFIYDKDSFALLGNFTYLTEGWGLTYDGKSLIMSDGSDTLRFLDPVTFKPVGQVEVHFGNATVANLNELEYIDGYVYANVFLQKQIAIIDPHTGLVKSWIDLSGLPGAVSSNPENVLNGIAYDAKGGRLFVTGKDWPHLYEIELVPKE